MLGPVPAAGGWTGQQRLKLSNLAVDGKMMHLQLAHVEIANSAAISVGEGYSPPLPLSPSPPLAVPRPPPRACLRHAHAHARAHLRTALAAAIMQWRASATPAESE